MKFSILIIFIAALSSCKHTGNSKNNKEQFPEFKFHMGTSKNTIISADIPDDRPFVLFFFSTTCPYSMAQTQEIKQNINLYNGIDIYFLSLDPLKDINEYVKTYNLIKYKNIHVGQDYTSAFIKYFKGKGFPFLAIYGKNKRYRYKQYGNINSVDLIAKLMVVNPK